MFDPDIEGVWAAELPDAHVDHGIEAFYASSREWLTAEVATSAAHVWTMRRDRAIRVEAYMDRQRALESAGLAE